ncbi:MAG: hypothetical protein HXX18_13835 [Bacteroidetes bacterium]|nr:hypothetical protein [Bacteroidota bacterium]
MFKIKMFITKLIHGEYSFKYVDLFRQNGLRSPFLRCIKDEFQFHILTFIKKDPKLKIFETSETIQFGNTSSSLTSDELLKTKGLPYCFNAFLFDEYEILMIGYHETIQNTKLKSIYTFANGVYIMGQYSFVDVKKEDSLNISKTLIKKYTADSTESLDKFFIKDKNKNYIYYADNGFDIAVKYFLVSDPKSKEIYSKFTDSILKTDTTNNKAIELKLNELF